MNINHITIKEAYDHDNDIIAYSVTVYYDNCAKATYEFFGETAEDIIKQTEAILPEAVADYFVFQTERYTENDTTIIECSESIYKALKQNKESRA